MHTDGSVLVPLDAIGVQGAPALDLARAAMSALGDLNRLRIFVLLKQGERCVCDIETELRLPQNLVSHHLRVLREAELISSRRDGRWIYYSIDLARLRVLHTQFGALFDPADVKVRTAQC